MVELVEMVPKELVQQVEKETEQMEQMVVPVVLVELFVVMYQHSTSQIIINL